MMIKQIFFCKIRIFDIASFLNHAHNNNIHVYQLRKVSEYTYTFKTPSSSYKKIIKYYNNIQIIKKEGIISIIISLLKYKTTLIAMVLSVCFYFALSSRIWSIKIYGDSQQLYSFINESLKKHELYIGGKMKNVDEISKIQSDILYDSYNVIEYLSIKINGCALDVNFKKKRSESETHEFKGALYAIKDGVIKSFDITSGEKVVKINDYVKKGDLLVSDILLTDYNKEVYVGTYGSVYAYTWYYVTIDEKINYAGSESELFANTLLSIKSNISQNYTKEEYIFEENVLQFNISNNKLFMQVHFTCVENIAKE